MIRSKNLRGLTLVLCGGLGLLAVACATGNEGAPAAASRGATAAGAPATSFQAQVAEGQKAYAEHCADCHGDNGEGGTKAPRVVGLAQGALPLDPPADRKYRKNRFVTVADVADFVVPNMPPGKGGSLPADQYWDILAFDLHANGVDLQQPLTPELAKTLTIPR
jgi:cytochrome c